MELNVRAYKETDLPEMIQIWNEVPKGFRMKDGHYEDICPYYCVL